MPSTQPKTAPPSQTQNNSSSSTQNQGKTKNEKSPSSQTSNKTIIFVLIGILIFLALVLLVGLGIGAWWYFSNKYRTGTPSVDLEPSPSSTEIINEGAMPEASEETTPEANQFLEPPDTIKNTIFYIRGKNVFKSKKDGTNEEKLTNFASSVGQVQNLAIIDPEHVGVFRCDTVTGNFGCKIFQINHLTKKVLQIKTFTAKQYLYLVGWANTDLFAYLYENSSGQHKLFVQNKGTSKIVASSSYIGGRGGMSGDNMRISFSPDKDRFFYINTAGKTGVDFTVYVYDAKGAQIDKITKATMPDWYDNNTIIYNGRITGQAGLYQRNLATKTSTKLANAGKTNYDIQIIGDQLLYWEDKGIGILHHYNLKTQTDQILVSDAKHPLWLNSEELIYTKTRKCQGDECDAPYPDEGMEKAFRLLNQSTSQDDKVDLVINKNYYLTTWWSQ